MESAFKPLTFNRGPQMKNRFMLAPLTNQQSNEDGTCSQEEHDWLTKRAEGGFGLTMTCAAHVQAEGKGFPGQLGVFSDEQLPGLKKLASAIKAHDSIAIAQLYHGGMRCPKDVIGMQPLSSSDNDKWGARAMTTSEVEEMIVSFIDAAVRAETAGFHGVELHGAHGYVLAQFLSPVLNQRSDKFGGSLAARQRPILEIIEGIRKKCNSEFMVGVRLSPERFGMELPEIVSLAELMMKEELIEFLDMSLWDVFKNAEDELYKSRPLLSIFTELDRKNVRLGVAGKIMSSQDIGRALDMGVDWVMLGRAAILHHDYPDKLKSDPGFRPIDLLVSPEHLLREGLSPSFVEYMKAWKGFVSGSEGFVDNELILNS